jgi:putative ABC transport system substrate-binding protein
LNRRIFLGTLGGGLLAAPLATEAQGERIARIGYLVLNPVARERRVRAPFLHGLRDLGYVEGRNLLIEYRDADGKPERFAALAAQLVALKVDVIVTTTGGTASALAAKQTTATLPIVFATAGDPVAEGIGTSLARPGGNVTGLSVVVPDLIGKSLELIKQVVPGVNRIALLVKPDSLPDRALKERLEAATIAAQALGVRLQVVEARGPQDFDRAFSDMTQARAGALHVLATGMFDTHRGRLVALAAENRLPTVYTFKHSVEDGGLMSYGPDLADLYRRAAIYVDKILKGAKPADLPVEQPTKFELTINLKTARALGLTIPQALLLRADEVIQ